MRPAAAGGYGGGYRGGYGYGYRGGFYGPGIGIGIGIYPYGYGYPYAYDPLIVPRVAYYPPSVVGIEGPLPPVAQVPAPAANVANIRVLVPDPNATVLFDGAKTSQTGSDRLFHTPALSGESSYRIRAIWGPAGKELTSERVVPVMPGQTSVVDFTQPKGETLPAPIPK